MQDRPYAVVWCKSRCCVLVFGTPCLMCDNYGHAINAALAAAEQLGASIELFSPTPRICGRMGPHLSQDPAGCRPLGEAGALPNSLSESGGQRAGRPQEH